MTDQRLTDKDLEEIRDFADTYDEEGSLRSRGYTRNEDGSWERVEIDSPDMIGTAYCSNTGAAMRMELYTDVHRLLKEVERLKNEILLMQAEQ